MPTARTLYLRGLGVVHLVATLSYLLQLEALVGSEGIAPATRLLAHAARIGRDTWHELPTLLWLWPTDAALYALCGLSLAAGTALVAGVRAEAPLLAVLAVAALSLQVVGPPFFQFQWDTLLVEATVMALLVARVRPQAPPTAPRWAWWMQWLLIARLMFFSGFVKLASGDPSWASLTALDVHYMTQPLPNPLSWTVHQLPHPLHAAAVVFTFVAELGLPWLVLAGARGRRVLFGGTALLMAGLALTGNYGFFQLLTVVVALSLLVSPASFDAPESPPAPRIARAGLAVPLLGTVLLQTHLQLTSADRLASWERDVLVAVAPFRIVNRYGLFAVMTTERPEIVLEGSDDGETWRELPLRYKPGALDRTPPQVAPHMPRVDWQLWFAALSSCERHPWLVHGLMQQIADGPSPVDGVFQAGTFDDGHPRYVRALRYRYRFTTPGHPDVWVREAPTRFCPVVARAPSGPR